MKREHIFEESILPEGYRKLEYVEGTGTQYFRFNANIDTNCIISGKCSHVRDNSNAFDCIIYSGSGNTRLFLLYNPNVPAFDYVWRNGYKSNRNVPSVANETPYEFSVSKNGIVFDGNDYLLEAPGNGTFSTDTWILSGNNGANITCTRLYWLEISKNDVSNYFLIPALRDSDSKPGVYDVVNNVFYTNRGTSEFLYN